jgi:galactonate dehydratase
VEEQGFSALKLSIRENYRSVDTARKVAQTVDTVSEIRDAIGVDVDLGVDFHGRSSKPMAKRIIDELEPYDPMWIEEPVLPEYIDEMADIADYTKIPIATGERMWNRWDFRDAFEKNALQVAQPDVVHAGGITELKKIGAMAEAYDNAFAPHMPYGPVALAASLQVDGCTPNAFIQEQLIHRQEPGVIEDLVENAEIFTLDDEGYVDIPDGPGLGIELNESYLETAEANWEPEYWYYDDGSVADK